MTMNSAPPFRAMAECHSQISQIVDDPSVLKNPLRAFYSTCWDKTDCELSDAKFWTTDRDFWKAWNDPGFQKPNTPPRTYKVENINWGGCTIGNGIDLLDSGSKNPKDGDLGFVDLDVVMQPESLMNVEEFHVGKLAVMDDSHLLIKGEKVPFGASMGGFGSDSGTLTIGNRVQIRSHALSWLPATVVVGDNSFIDLGLVRWQLPRDGDKVEFASMNVGENSNVKILKPIRGVAPVNSPYVNAFDREYSTGIAVPGFKIDLGKNSELHFGDKDASTVEGIEFKDGALVAREGSLAKFVNTKVVLKAQTQLDIHEKATIEAEILELCGANVNLAAGSVIEVSNLHICTDTKISGPGILRVANNIEIIGTNGKPVLTIADGAQVECMGVDMNVQIEGDSSLIFTGDLTVQPDTLNIQHGSVAVRGALTMTNDNGMDQFFVGPNSRLTAKSGTIKMSRFNIGSGATVDLGSSSVKISDTLVLKQQATLITSSSVNAAKVVFEKKASLSCSVFDAEVSDIADGVRIDASDAAIIAPQGKEFRVGTDVHLSGGVIRFTAYEIIIGDLFISTAESMEVETFKGISVGDFAKVSKVNMLNSGKKISFGAPSTVGTIVLSASVEEVDVPVTFVESTTFKYGVQLADKSVTFDFMCVSSIVKKEVSVTDNELVLDPTVTDICPKSDFFDEEERPIKNPYQPPQSTEPAAKTLEPTSVKAPADGSKAPADGSKAAGELIDEAIPNNEKSGKKTTTTVLYASITICIALVAIGSPMIVYGVWRKQRKSKNHAPGWTDMPGSSHSSRPGSGMNTYETPDVNQEGLHLAAAASTQAQEVRYEEPDYNSDEDGEWTRRTNAEYSNRGDLRQHYEQEEAEEPKAPSTNVRVSTISGEYQTLTLVNSSAVERLHYVNGKAAYINNGSPSTSVVYISPKDRSTSYTDTVEAPDFEVFEVPQADISDPNLVMRQC